MEEATKTYHHKLLEIVIKQEESLQLDHIDTADAWQLGLILRDLGMKSAPIWHCTSAFWAHRYFTAVWGNLNPTLTIGSPARREARWSAGKAPCA